MVSCLSSVKVTLTPSPANPLRQLLRQRTTKSEGKWRRQTQSFTLSDKDVHVSHQA